MTKRTTEMAEGAETIDLPSSTSVDSGRPMISPHRVFAGGLVLPTGHDWCPTGFHV
jgi:hypothetical protein